MTISAGVVDVDQVRTDLQAVEDGVATETFGGDKDHQILYRKTALAAADALNLRTIAWVQTDDQELRALFLRVTDTVAGRVVTMTLTVDGGDTRFLVDETISLSVTTVNGTADTRSDHTATGAVRIRLKRGVRYRLTVTNTTGGTTTGVVVGGCQVRAMRRRK